MQSPSGIFRQALHSFSVFYYQKILGQGDVGNVPNRWLGLCFPQRGRLLFLTYHRTLTCVHTVTVRPPLGTPTASTTARLAGGPRTTVYVHTCGHAPAFLFGFVFSNAASCYLCSAPTAGCCSTAGVSVHAAFYWS